jgi:hypothetical protein
MLAVSTRSELVRKGGLAPFVKRLLQRRVPSVIVEASATGVALEGTAEALAAVEPPVIAFIGPATPPSDFPDSHLASAAPAARTAALRALSSTLPWLLATRCRRLVIPVGAPGLAGEETVRKKLADPGVDTRLILRAAKAASAAQRQLHAEVVCRSLFELRRALEGIRVLLLPVDDALGFLDPETAEWIFGDVKGLGLALDTGAIAASEVRGGTPLSEWLGRPASSLGLILLADHDGRGDGALLPGAGRLDFARLRDVIGPGLPHAVRCDPRASFDDVLASSEEASRKLGPIGDPSAW